jgi:hypothetical protein
MLFGVMGIRIVKDGLERFDLIRHETVFIKVLVLRLLVGAINMFERFCDGVNDIH